MNSQALCRTAVYLGAALAICLSPDLGSGSESITASDLSISRYIADRLEYDPAINALVDVRCSKGIVTLNGRVDNALAAFRAARVAESVRGVVAVINQIETVPVPRDDNLIRRDVLDALRAEPAVNADLVSIIVQHGTVTLRGSLGSSQAAEVARMTVLGVRGVRGVEDQIEVVYQDRRADETILREARFALVWNVFLYEDAIDISVSQGVVKLTGTTGSVAEKRLAERLVRVAGVVAVDDAGLVVDPGVKNRRLRPAVNPARSPRELHAAVEATLRADVRVLPAQIEVEVVEGTITLRGTVETLRAKNAAIQDARNTVGVDQVVSRLKIRPRVNVLDPLVGESVRNAILNDPYLYDADIGVTMLQGTAMLRGTVATDFERLRAEELASRTAGVLKVDNQLKASVPGAFVTDPLVDDGVVNGAGDQPRRGAIDLQIRRNVERHLQRSAMVDASRVQVAVEDGTVTLSGAARSLAELQAAARSAYRGGAAAVNNLIRVELP